MVKNVKTAAGENPPEDLPEAHALVTDPETAECAENKPLPKEVAETPIEQKSPAEWAYERIVLYIQNFEEQLDAEHEVGMGFAGGDVGTLRIQGMGYFAPDILTFYGEDPDGAKTQLVQHVSQLNVLLRAAPKENDGTEANRIGFRLAADLKNSAKKTKIRTPEKKKVKNDDQTQ